MTMNTKSDYTYEQARFDIFLLYRLSEKWKRPVPFVYRVLKDSKILDEYINPCFDVLHTQGESFLTDDITSFVLERGYEI